MTHEPDKFTEPDVFAAELHHWLLVEGPRSTSVRQLMRLARRHPDAELERIFEKKLAEAKRFHRETRRPTLLHLPRRAMEWLRDHAQLVPLREAAITLFYTGVVLLGMDYARQRLFPDDGEQPSLSVTHGYQAFDVSSRVRAPHTSPAATPADRVDRWFADEVATALDGILASDEFQLKLKSVVHDALDVRIAEAQRQLTQPPAEAPTDDAGNLASASVQPATIQSPGGEAPDASEATQHDILTGDQ